MMMSVNIETHVPVRSGKGIAWNVNTHAALKEGYSSLKILYFISNHNINYHVYYETLDAV